MNEPSGWQSIPEIYIKMFSATKNFITVYFKNHKDLLKCLCILLCLRLIILYYIPSCSLPPMSWNIRKNSIALHRAASESYSKEITTNISTISRTVGIEYKFSLAFKQTTTKSLTCFWENSLDRQKKTNLLPYKLGSPSSAA